MLRLIYQQQQQQQNTLNNFILPVPREGFLHRTLRATRLLTDIESISSLPDRNMGRVFFDKAARNLRKANRKMTHILILFLLRTYVFIY